MCLYQYLQPSIDRVGLVAASIMLCQKGPLMGAAACWFLNKFKPQSKIGFAGNAKLDNLPLLTKTEVTDY